MGKYLKSVVKDTLKYGIGSVLQRFIGFFLMPIYTRIFTPADYGIMNIIFTVSSLLGTLLTFGMAGSFFRYYHEYDEDDKVVLASTIQIFRLFASFLICSVLALFSKQISGGVLGDGKYYDLILLSLATIILSTMWDLTVDILRVQFRVIWYNYIQVGGLLLQTVLSILFVVFLKYGLFGLFFAQLISNIVICSSSLWITRKSYSLKFNISILKNQLTFGIGFLPSLFTNWVTSSSDRIFLSRFAKLSDVGIYSISNQIATPVRLLTSSFRTAWVPTAYRDLNKDESPRNFSQTGLYYATLISFVVLGCSLFSSDIVHILTPESYHRSYLYVPIITYGMLFEGLNLMFAEGLNFANKPYYRSLSFVIGAILNFSLNFYFIPKFQILGASITTLLAYLTTFLLGYYWAVKFYPRIKYDIRKVFLIVLYCVPFIVIGFLIDREYALINILYKFGIYILVVCSLILIFFRVDAKNVIRRYRKSSKEV